MLVLHIRDLLLGFIGIIVDLCLFIRLITLIHIILSALSLLFVLWCVLLVLLLVLIRPVRFLPLLVRFLILLVTLLRLGLFVFLLVHITHFKPLRILLPGSSFKKSCHAPASHATFNI